MILAHVIIALASIAYTTYLFFAPSRIKLYIGYGLTGLTLLSGVYLVLSTQAPMLPACEAGLAYLIIVTVGLTFAHRRLAS